MPTTNSSHTAFAVSTALTEVPLRLPLSDLVLDGPSARIPLDHPYVLEKAESIASEGFAGYVHVVPHRDDYEVVSGGHTVLALRHLVAFDRVVWDRQNHTFRPAREIYRQVDCLIDG